MLRMRRLCWFGFVRRSRVACGGAFFCEMEFDLLAELQPDSLPATEGHDRMNMRLTSQLWGIAIDSPIDGLLARESLILDTLAAQSKLTECLLKLSSCESPESSNAPPVPALTDAMKAHGTPFPLSVPPFKMPDLSGRLRHSGVS